MDFSHSARTQDYLKRIRNFINDDIMPVEAVHLRETQERKYGADWTQWQVSPEVEQLKARARDGSRRR